jgi:hypothetical protein
LLCKITAGAHVTTPMVLHPLPILNSRTVCVISRRKTEQCTRELVPNGQMLSTRTTSTVLNSSIFGLKTMVTTTLPKTDVNNNSDSKMRFTTVLCSLRQLTMLLLVSSLEPGELMARPISDLSNSTRSFSAAGVTPNLPSEGQISRAIKSRLTVNLLA